MNSVLYLLAPAALLLPGVAGADLARRADLLDPVAGPAMADFSVVPEIVAAEADVVKLEGLRDPQVPPVVRQVSIEQRVTIRVAPRMSTAPIAFDSASQNGAGPRFAEKKMGKCVPVSGIVGVQYRDANRLVLYLRDRRMVSATLEKACHARDYYSGFYVARNSDGMLCSDRDEIRARSGASCQISALRQLVPDDD